MDGRDQLFGSRSLQHVSKGTGLEASILQERITVHRDEHDSRGRILPEDRGGGRNPIQPRHGDVADDHVGQQARGGADELEAAFDVSDYVELRLEETAQERCRFLVVVGEYQGLVGHLAVLVNGLSL